MSDSLKSLPPELQARIAQIVQGSSPELPESPHQAAIAKPIHHHRNHH